HRYVMDMEINASNPQVLFQTTIDGLRRSEDGGDTWKRTEDSHMHALAIAPSEPNVAYLGTGKTRHGEIPGADIYGSQDGGRSWQSLSIGFPPNQEEVVVSEIVVDPRDSATVYAGTSTFDFDNIADGIPGLYKTKDGGESWFSLGLEGADVHDLLLVPSDSNRLYVASESGLLYTEDGGGTWAKLLEGRMLSLAMEESNEALFVGTGNHSGVMVSTDGGATWAEVTNGLPNLACVNDITSSQGGIYAAVGVRSSCTYGLHLHSSGGLYLLHAPDDTQPLIATAIAVAVVVTVALLVRRRIKG
ncbi:MAG: hypothetical protein ACE5KH_04990, partial [Candidatus Geothermarchaeales archaeon]